MLTVDVILYSREAGGRPKPITDIGYDCSCKAKRDGHTSYNCRINFYNRYPVYPGETQRADVFFLTGEDAEALFLAAGKFYLYEDGLIGEALALPTRRRLSRHMDDWTSDPQSPSDLKQASMRLR